MIGVRTPRSLLLSRLWLCVVLERKNQPLCSHALPLDINSAVQCSGNVVFGWFSLRCDATHLSVCVPSSCSFRITGIIAFTMPRLWRVSAMMYSTSTKSTRSSAPPCESDRACTKQRRYAYCTSGFHALVPSLSWQNGGKLNDTCPYSIHGAFFPFRTSVANDLTQFEDSSGAKTCEASRCSRRPQVQQVQ
jgi:hypothetical protein